MIRSRLGLKALVLSGLVLGLMAFSSSAQAETGANWFVNGSAISSTLLPQLEISEIENNSASLAFTTKGGTGVLILCGVAKFDEGGQLTSNGGISLGMILFTGCKVLLNEVAAPKCEAHSPGKAAGSILSEKGEGLIVLDKEVIEGKEVISNLVKITPKVLNAEKKVVSSKLFAVIELGASCAIGESVNVEATALGEGLWIKDCKGSTSFTTEAVTHLVEEGLNKLLALGQPAKIIGSANVVLSGAAHKGLKWSGKPF
jgi:hypothetical protein